MGRQETFWNDGNVLYLDLSGSYTGIYISNHQVVRLTRACYPMLFIPQNEIKSCTIQLAKIQSFIMRSYVASGNAKWYKSSETQYRSELHIHFQFSDCILGHSDKHVFV